MIKVACFAAGVEQPKHAFARFKRGREINAVSAIRRVERRIPSRFSKDPVDTLLNSTRHRDTSLARSSLDCFSSAEIAAQPMISAD
jgi:hypothetical protein